MPGCKTVNDSWKKCTDDNNTLGDAEVAPRRKVHFEPTRSSVSLVTDRKIPPRYPREGKGKKSSSF